MFIFLCLYLFIYLFYRKRIYQLLLILDSKSNYTHTQKTHTVGFFGHLHCFIVTVHIYRYFQSQFIAVLKRKSGHLGLVFGQVVFSHIHLIPQTSQSSSHKLHSS